MISLTNIKLGMRMLIQVNRFSQQKDSSKIEEKFCLACIWKLLICENQCGYVSIFAFLKIGNEVIQLNYASFSALD